METLGDEEFYRSEDPSAYLLRVADFERFIELEYKRIAYDYYADVTLTSPDSKHDVKLAHDRYVALHASFESSIGKNKDGRKTGRPNQFKIAAALCFSLRRARPIAHVAPSFDFARRMREGNLAGLHEVEGTGLESIAKAFIYFLPLADEICAFEIGLRVAKHLTVQSDFPNSHPELFAALADHYHPSLTQSDYTNVFVTLRDHATSPYSLLVLYSALFSKPFRS